MRKSEVRMKQPLKMRWRRRQEKSSERSKRKTSKGFKMEKVVSYV